MYGFMPKQPGELDPTNLPDEILRRLAQMLRDSGFGPMGALRRMFSRMMVAPTEGGNLGSSSRPGTTGAGPGGGATPTSSGGGPSSIPIV